MGMIRSAVSVAALAVSLGSVAFAAEEGAGMRLDDLETALSVTGWDIVHRTEATDGSIVIGARSHQGWPVIHTLSNCDEGTCAVWSQATPLESGLVGKAVSYSGNGLDDFGNALFGDRNATGQLTLRAAMIGVPDALKGTALVCVCVANPGVETGEALRHELSQAIVAGYGASYRPRDILFVNDLPKTRSLKIMRRLIRSVYLNEPRGDTAALVNPEAVTELEHILLPA